MFYSESELPHKLQPPGSCLPPAIGIRLLNPGSVPSIPAVTGPLASHRCCASSNCPLPSAVGCLSLAMAVGSPASPWWPTAGPGSSMELMLAGHLFHTKVPGETSRHCLFYPVATPVGTGTLVKPPSDGNTPLAVSCLCLSVNLQLQALCSHYLTPTPWFQPGVGDPGPLSAISVFLPPLHSRATGSRLSSEFCHILAGVILDKLLNCFLVFLFLCKKSS